MLIIIFSSWLLHSIGNILFFVGFLRFVGQPPGLFEGRRSESSVWLMQRRLGPLRLVDRGRYVTTPPGSMYFQWNAVISWKIWWFLTGLKWPLNGHFKPFRAIRSIRNGFGVQISSSLIPVMSKIIKFEPMLKDFDGKYDDQHDHKNCYKPNLD